MMGWRSCWGDETQFRQREYVNMLDERRPDEHEFEHGHAELAETQQRNFAARQTLMRAMA